MDRKRSIRFNSGAAAASLVSPSPIRHSHSFVSANKRALKDLQHENRLRNDEQMWRKAQKPFKMSRFAEIGSAVERALEDQREKTRGQEHRNFLRKHQGVSVVTKGVDYTQFHKEFSQIDLDNDVQDPSFYEGQTEEKTCFEDIADYNEKNDCFSSFSNVAQAVEVSSTSPQQNLDYSEHLYPNIHIPLTHNRAMSKPASNDINTRRFSSGESPKSRQTNSAPLTHTTLRPATNNRAIHSANTTIVTTTPCRASINFMAANAQSVLRTRSSTSNAAAHLLDPSEPKTTINRHRDFGKVPAYLEMRKAERVAQIELERELKEKASIPPGMKLLDEEERLATLANLRMSADEVEKAISALPLRIVTFSRKKQRDDLHAKLADIESAITLFSKKKVYINSA